MRAAARIFSREVVETVVIKGMKTARGCEKEIEGMPDKLNALDLGDTMKGNLQDMDMISAELVK